ncbi:MAG: Iron-regulated protein precursor [Labilithrix sp.]|nr:Iron-regulated protein precursor [Labilithrix sp.]
MKSTSSQTPSGRLARLLGVASCVTLVGLASACSSDDGASSGSSSSSGGPGGAEAAAVVKQYATMVHANYEESLAQMKLLQSAVDAFVAAPSAAGLVAAKAAWVAARPSYLQSEVYRFYNGPIDNEADGPEGMINSWPIDENFVDYVVGDATAGIINKKTGDAFTFPTIDAALIQSENEDGGEKNLSAGWHVIEFLLWGQDLKADGTPNTDGTGTRPFTDYVDNGTAQNQARRRAYLKAATDLMVEQFASVEAQWELDDPQTYGAKMVAGDPAVALGNILKGVGSMAATELPKERINNAYETKDQEEEHSCFSDTTTSDLYNNALGVENVYLGRYGALTGASLSQLVAAKDAALDTRTKADIAAAVAATKAIPQPFDTAILGDDAAPGRVAVKNAKDAWTPVKDDLVAVAAALDVKINLAEQ